MGKLISEALYSFKYPGFRKDLDSIRMNHYLPIEDLRHQQDLQLQKIIKHVFETVPFYQNYKREHQLKASDIKTQYDLHLLPVIQKKDLLQQREAFYSNQNLKYVNSSTGGSTGEPLKYRMSPGCTRYNQLIKLRAWGISGYQPGDKLCIFAGGSLYDKQNLRNELIHKLTNTLAFSSYGVTEEDLLHIYEIIDIQKPKYFYGYVSAWMILSEFMQKYNFSFTYQPKALFSTSEVLLPTQRRLIGEVMNVEVYDEYGLNDSGASAHECEEHHGQHIDFERAILQVVDENGTILENGTGKVIATSLRNYAMPFIRYDTGDIATITTEPCACGRTTPRLMKLEGRSTDYLSVHGVYIGSPVLTVLMGKLDVISYRIIQENEDTIKIELVVNEDIFQDLNKREEVKKKITESFAAKLPSAKLEIVFYSSLIDFGTQNKHKFIINKMNQKMEH